MKRRPLTDNLPDYETAQRFLQILAGTRYSDYVAMMNDIYAHIGNPQSQVDWSRPDEWIPLRLNGDSERLAARFWNESENLVNPRHSFEMRALGSYHGLAVYAADVVEVTEKGKRFIDGDVEVVRAIDEYEGVIFVLSEIMVKGPCRRLELIESFTEFCHTYTTWKAHTSIDSALSARFRHLRQRALVERIGHTYHATDAGISYLMRHYQEDSSGRGMDIAIHKLVNDNNMSVEEQLREFLQTMDPYQFEHLIKWLLEEMGYENVEVTSGSNDKGVDVVADIALGISRVREVIQVKRWKDNVGGPVLNALRGSLPLFGAMRGSIVTTAGFTKQARDSAFVPGAPPITLIDGKKLLDLLIEHDIGIRRREIRILEFDEESLSQFSIEEESVDVASELTNRG